MFGQTNDLQKAIDQVNNNGGSDVNAASGTSSGDAGSDFSTIQDQLGVPPMPPTEGAGVPPMPAPFGAEISAPAAPAPNEASTAENVPVSVGTDGANGGVNPEVPASEQATADNVSSDNSANTNNEVAGGISSEPSAEQILGEDSDIAKIREDTLRELMPLIDKVEGNPEQKFEIYKEAMETLHDKGLVSGAYKQASQITDENKKAESLMELLKAIDTLK